MLVSLPAGYKSVHVVVTGRVQGVWYRAWTGERATDLGVDGWVRNLKSGAVEGLFAGPAEAVDQLVAACRSGPPLARVDDVVCREAPEAEAVELLNQGFQSRPSD